MDNTIQNKQQFLDDLLNHAVDQTDGKVSYVTNIRFSMGENEVFLDLYSVGPDPNDGQTPIATRTHRIVLTPRLAKAVSTRILKAMSRREDALEAILPDENDSDSEFTPEQLDTLIASAMKIDAWLLNELAKQ